MPKHQPGVSRRNGLLHKHSLVQKQDKPSGSSNKSPFCEEARKISPEAGQGIQNTKISFQLLHCRICKRTCCIWVRRSPAGSAVPGQPAFLSTSRASAPGLLTVGIQSCSLLLHSCHRAGCSLGREIARHQHPTQTHWCHTNCTELTGFISPCLSESPTFDQGLATFWSFCHLLPCKPEGFDAPFPREGQFPVLWESPALELSLSLGLLWQQCCPTPCCRSIASCTPRQRHKQVNCCSHQEGGC